jgi:glycopeptide antibiotics resistance protein
MRFWPFWILVVVAASGPWFGIVREPQWDRVTWIPFTGFGDKPRDMIVNVLLYVPFGWSYVKNRSRRASVLGAIAAAALVSIAVEIPQLFYRLRDPSATDVVMAVIGAAAGSFASQALNRGNAGGAERRREAGESRGQEQESRG